MQDEAVLVFAGVAVHRRRERARGQRVLDEREALARGVRFLIDGLDHFQDEDALFAACSSHWRATNPPPHRRTWSSIEDPAARTRTALGELYAFYSRTEPMYGSLLRDEPLVPAVQRRLRDFYGYLRSIQDDLAAGRYLRGRRAQYARAAIGHAVSFPTWRSLTREQGLSNDDAVELMCRLIEDATSSSRA